jgi:predicted small lipoprotein YifL
MNMLARNDRRMSWRAAAVAALSLCALCACGQKGALFLPDRGPQPVISPPAATGTDATPIPNATPIPEAAPTPGTEATSETPTTRKAPRDPDPATAR